MSTMFMSPLPLFAIDGYVSRLSEAYEEIIDERGKGYINKIKANVGVMSNKIYENLEVIASHGVQDRVKRH